MEELQSYKWVLKPYNFQSRTMGASPFWMFPIIIENMTFSMPQYLYNQPDWDRLENLMECWRKVEYESITIINWCQRHYNNKQNWMFSRNIFQWNDKANLCINMSALEFHYNTTQNMAYVMAVYDMVYVMHVILLELALHMQIFLKKVIIYYSEKAWACVQNGITQRGRLADGDTTTSPSGRVVISPYANPPVVYCHSEHMPNAFSLLYHAFQCE